MATFESDSWCRMEGEGEEEGGGERSYNGQVALKGKDSRGRNSWNEMPKFLLAGAVSTIVSRCLSLSPQMFAVGPTSIC